MIKLRTTKLCQLSLLLGCIHCFGSLFSQTIGIDISNDEANELSRVFILHTFDTLCESSQSSAIMLARFLESKLVDEYEILEREQLELVLQEQRKSLSGIFSSGSTLQVGELLGADGVIICSDQCSSNGESIQFVKIIDGESGKLLLSGSAYGVDPFVFANKIEECIRLGKGFSSIRTQKSDTNIGQTDSNTEMACESLEFQGRSYKLTKYGRNCWFAEDLKTTDYSNGDRIFSGSEGNNWINSRQGLFAQGPLRQVLDEQNELYVISDVYYNGIVSFDSRGVCPTGWHVSTDQDWMNLEALLGVIMNDLTKSGERIAAKEGLSLDEIFTTSAGYKSDLTGSISDQDKGYYWTSSTYGNLVWYRAISPNNSIVRNVKKPQAGMNIRCVKD